VVFETFPCEADEASAIGLLEVAFGCPKENIEDAGPLTSGADEGAVVGCGLCVKKLGIVELVGAELLAVGADTEVCVVGVGAGAGAGAEGKENNALGSAVDVLASGLAFASFDWALEDGVGILNRGGGLEGSVACEPPFGSVSRENAGVDVERGAEGFSSGFVSETTDGAGAIAAFLASASFASASALAFSFSSALRRRRAIASASISCFSHFE
jgi:hypothetical protein